LAAKTANAKTAPEILIATGASLVEVFPVLGEPVVPASPVGVVVEEVKVGADIDGRPPPLVPAVRVGTDIPDMSLPELATTVLVVVTPAPPSTAVLVALVPVSLTPLQSGLPEASTEQVSPAGQQKL